MRRALFLFPLGVALLTLLPPFWTLSSLDEYRGPLDLLQDRLALFNLHNGAVTGLAFLYALLAIAFDGRALRMRTVAAFFVVTVALGAISYPVVYDPLFYHYTAGLWVEQGVNLYTQLLDVYERFPFPVVGFPVYNNYHYGPPWLLLTGLLYVLAGGSFAGFLLLLKFLALGALAASLRILKTWFNTDLSLVELLFFCGFNPIVLIFILNTGHQEPLLALLLLSALYTARRQQLVVMAALLCLTFFLKISAWPVLLLVTAWIIGRQRSARTRLWSLGAMAAGALVVVIPLLLIFGFSPAYLSGIEQWLAVEYQSWASLSGAIVLPLARLGLPFDSGALREFLRLLFMLLNLGLVALFSLRHLRGATFEMLVRNVWLVLMLNPFLSDVGIRAWYLLPPLFLAMLLGRGERDLTVVVTALTVLASVPFSYVMLTQDTPRVLFYIVAQFIAHLIPTFLLLGYLLRSFRSFHPRRHSALSLAGRH